MIRRLTILLIACLAPVLPASAQQLPALSGVWDCVLNNPYVSVQVRMQLSPNGSLRAQGWLHYVGTSSQGNFTGTGQYGPVPPEPGAPAWRYGFRIVRNNGPMVPLYAGPTNNPGWLYSVFQNPQTGQRSETSCSRVG